MRDRSCVPRARGRLGYSEMIGRRSGATGVPVRKGARKMNFANVFALVRTKRRMAISANPVTNMHTGKIDVYVLYIKNKRAVLVSPSDKGSARWVAAEAALLLGGV